MCSARGVSKCNRYSGIGEYTQEEAVSKLNCTPKVRQKTFGVQFVYEKDICRKT